MADNSEEASEGRPPLASPPQVATPGTTLQGATPDETLAQTLTSLQAALQTGRPPRDFSPESVGVLLERQSEYVEELGLEAIRIARRARADVVSAVDVEHADEIVRSAERARRSRLYETVG